MTKTKQEVMDLLCICCNNSRVVRKILEENPDEIDLSDRDGLILGVVVAHDYMESLILLLDFYKKTKLNFPENSRQYKIAYKELQYLLYDAQDGCWPSDRIRAILDPYLVGVDDDLSSLCDDILEEEMAVLPADDISDDTTKERSSDESKDSEEHVKILPFTMQNIYALNYPYWSLNIEAEESYRKGDAALAIDKITRAAKVVMHNPNITFDLEHKVVVIYNYLRFLGEGALALEPENKFTDYVQKALYLAEEVEDHEMRDQINNFLKPHQEITEFRDEVEGLKTDHAELSGVYHDLQVELDQN